MRMSRRTMRKARRAKRQGMVTSVNLVSMIDIFTILIIYLLVNAVAVQVIGAEQVDLPESLAQEQPRENTVVIISKDDILVDGSAVMKVAEAESTEGNILLPLQQRLAVAVPPTQPPPAAGAPPPVREVNILADKGIPYSVLKKVMATSGGANFARISLGVIPKAAGD